MSVVSRRRGKLGRPARVGDGCSQGVFIFLRCIACDLGLDERGLNRLLNLPLPVCTPMLFPSSASGCHVDVMLEVLAASASQLAAQLNMPATHSISDFPHADVDH